MFIGCDTGICLSKDLVWRMASRKQADFFKSLHTIVQVKNMIIMIT